jgi:hypothetical protein
MTIFSLAATRGSGRKEKPMILVRDIFQLKFGKMKEAKEIWKEILKLSSNAPSGSTRMLTDLTGAYYTLVFEHTFKDLGDYEATAQAQMSTPGMGPLYQKFVPLVDSGRREIFSIVD